MKLFLASFWKRTFLEYNKHFPERKLNLLRSFGVPSYEDNDFFVTLRDNIDSIILDSGTYTLNNPQATQADKSKITLEGYKEYALTVSEYCDHIFNFDSEWDEEKCFDGNLYSQRCLEEAGLTPVPVIHSFYSKEVNYYVDQGYRIVALGSVLVRDIHALAPVVLKFHKAGVKVHLFGTTTYDLIAPLPVYSCDSSSWAMTGAYGNVNYWNPHKEGKNKTDKIYMEEYIHLEDKNRNYFSTYKYKEEFEQYLYDAFQFTHEDFLGVNKDYNIHLTNTHYYIELERRINEEHRKKGILVE